MNPTHAVSLRPASPDDLDPILMIENESYPEPWKRSHFEKELATNYARFLVLTDDETDSVIIGYIIYWIQAEGVSLMNVTVNPKWKGLGFAKMLMQAMIRETVREEIPKIILEVRESNQAAIRLYEGIGFKKTHERRKFYQDGETAWVMEIKTSDIHPTIQ
jgi:ribosomal-protein-alanine N-acetyltransferase